MADAIDLDALIERETYHFIHRHSPRRNSCKIATLIADIEDDELRERIEGLVHSVSGAGYARIVTAASGTYVSDKTALEHQDESCLCFRGKKHTDA